jgi:hypothetical protein
LKPRDWLLLGGLLAAALWFGWDRLAGTPVGQAVQGACEPHASRWHFRCHPRPE